MSSEALERAEALLAVEPGSNVKSAAWWFAAARDMAREVAKLEAALAVAREREQLLHDYLADVASCTPHKRGCDEPDDPSCAACIAAAGLAAHAAALVDEPAAAETGFGECAACGGAVERVGWDDLCFSCQESEKAEAEPYDEREADQDDDPAADEPRKEWLARLHEDPAADEPGETP